MLNFGFFHSKKNVSNESTPLLAGHVIQINQENQHPLLVEKIFFNVYEFLHGVERINFQVPSGKEGQAFLTADESDELDSITAAHVAPQLLSTLKQVKKSNSNKARFKRKVTALTLFAFSCIGALGSYGIYLASTYAIQFAKSSRQSFEESHIIYRDMKRNCPDILDKYDVYGMNCLIFCYNTPMLGFSIEYETNMRPLFLNCSASRTENYVNKCIDFNSVSFQKTGCALSQIVIFLFMLNIFCNPVTHHWIEKKARSNRLLNPLPSLESWGESENSIIYYRIFNHFNSAGISLREMMERIKTFIEDEAIRGTYLRTTHCLLFNKADNDTVKVKSENKNQPTYTKKNYGTYGP